MEDEAQCWALVCAGDSRQKKGEEKGSCSYALCRNQNEYEGRLADMIPLVAVAPFLPFQFLCFSNRPSCRLTR